MSDEKWGDGISWEDHIRQVVGGRTPDEVFLKLDGYGRELVERLLKTISTGYMGTPKLADCGCYVGRWVDVFSNDFDYTGIDQSLDALEYARTHRPCHTWVHSFLWNIPFVEVFDAAISFAVLQHNTLDEQQKIIQNIHTLLKPGGSFMMTESTLHADTRTQRTYEHWIEVVSKTGFEFIESWHQNELGLEDSYLFRRI